jgi:hypothetical protein
MNIHSARSELSNPPRIAWAGMLAEVVLAITTSAILVKFFVA